MHRVSCAWAGVHARTTARMAASGVSEPGERNRTADGSRVIPGKCLVAPPDHFVVPPSGLPFRRGSYKLSLRYIRHRLFHLFAKEFGDLSAWHHGNIVRVRRTISAPHSPFPRPSRHPRSPIAGEGRGGVRVKTKAQPPSDSCALSLVFGWSGQTGMFVLTCH